MIFVRFKFLEANLSGGKGCIFVALSAPSGTLPCNATGHRRKSHRRIDMERASQVNQCELYWKSLLQSLVTVTKFIA